MAEPLPAQTSTEPLKWGKVIDHASCIGCHACTTACKSENDVPLSVTRTYVKYVDVGTFPQARRAFQVTRCNQCEDPPCVAACPTQAMHQRPDGIVDFDKSICIGCKACIAACPYDAIFINPRITRPRSATSALTASTSGWSRPAWSSAPPRPSWSGT